jgi:hypothetical protein
MDPLDLLKSWSGNSEDQSLWHTFPFTARATEGFLRTPTMAAHLAHKIPWESLCEMLIATGEGVGWRRHVPSQARKKKLEHIGRLIVHTLREFQSTCTTTEEELAVLNAKAWRIGEQSHGGYIGYYDSLLKGYVELNLLLTNPHRMAPLLCEQNGECSYYLARLLGYYDGGHPAAIADNLAPAFDGRTLKPLTAEVMQTLRDHAALLFRCMYIMPGENKLLDEVLVTDQLFGYFSWFSTVEPED